MGVDAPDGGLEDLRRAADEQRAVLGTRTLDVDPASLVRFAPDLPRELPAERRAELEARAAALEPWLQGPFLLGGDLVVGGTWRNDLRWAMLAERVPDVHGRRVLDVGSNAGYDPFMFNLRGAASVLACEPFAFFRQAQLLEEVYRSGVDFRQIGWQGLSPEEHGTFDLVHCHGVLYHECDPMGLLERLFEMTKPGGLCLFGSMMHADPALSDLARMVPLAYFGDDTWWWTPGPAAMRQMLEAAGFEVEKTFGVSTGPPGEFPTINGYFRCLRPAENR